MSTRNVVAVGLTVLVSAPVVWMAYNGQLTYETAATRIAIVIAFSLLASWVFDAMLPSAPPPQPPAPATPAPPPAAPAQSSMEADAAALMGNTGSELTWPEDPS